MNESDETTAAADGAPSAGSDGGLVALETAAETTALVTQATTGDTVDALVVGGAPATAPIPGTVEPHPLAPDAIPEPGADEPFVLDDPGLLPAPDPTTRVDGLGDPVEPPRGWTLGDVAAATGRFLAVFWAMTVMWMVVFALLPLLVGWTPTVVVSGSMAPTVPAGTVVHVDPGVDLQRLGTGSIITYDDPNVEGRKITHRVVEVVRDGETGPTIGFRTQGDANTEEDSEIVPLDSVDGATRLVLPYAGLPQVWMEDGRWWLVVLVMLGTAIAGIVALDTVSSYVTGRTMFRRRSVTAAVAIAIAVMLGGPASNAAFAASTDALGSDFSMTSNWYLEAIDADVPVAHWRLDDAAGGSPVVILNEGFESPVTLNRIGSGQVARTPAEAHTGNRSAEKRSNDDPNGAWSPLPTTVTGSFTFDVWVFRPSNFPGGSVDRLGLEDATFGGYTFYSSHTGGGGGSLRIDRRDGGNATGIGSTVSYDPPEDEWYRLRLQKAGSSLVASAYDGAGNLLAVTSAVDSTYSSFDRWVVRGGHDYYVDDLTITQDPPPVTAIDRIGTEDGQVIGAPIAQRPPLLTGLPGSPASFEFDGTSAVYIGDDPLINTTTRDERTVELWFSPTSTIGRQVLYEEGGGINGLSIYLDGDRLYGRAWGQSTGWSNPLEVSTSPGSIVVGQRHHVAVVLDAVTDRSLELWIDGALVGTATKTDSGSWSAHTDDGAIAGVNSGTEFHDGTSSNPSQFSGIIDEVVVFNSALDAERVEAHWFAGR